MSDALSGSCIHKESRVKTDEKALVEKWTLY